MSTVSRLQAILDSGQLAVTSECGPPRGADPEAIRQKGELLKGCVDAVNVTDNQTAVVRMSSLAACIHLKLRYICRQFVCFKYRVALFFR